MTRSDILKYDKRYVPKCNDLLNIAKEKLDALQFTKARDLLLALQQLNEKDTILSYPKLHLKILNLLASAERHMRMMEQAMARLRRCMEICACFDCETGETLITMSAVYMDLNDYQQAKICCEEALQQFIDSNIREKNNNSSRLIATCYYNIGQCYLELKKPGKAANSFSSGMTALKKLVVEPRDFLLQLLKKSYASSVNEARSKDYRNESHRSVEPVHIQKDYISIGYPVGNNKTKENSRYHRKQASREWSNNEKSELTTFIGKKKSEYLINHRKHLSANFIKGSYCADNKTQVSNYMPLRAKPKQLFKNSLHAHNISNENVNECGLVGSWKESAEAEISLESSGNFPSKMNASKAVVDLDRLKQSKITSATQKLVGSLEVHKRALSFGQNKTIHKYLTKGIGQLSSQREMASKEDYYDLEPSMRSQVTQLKGEVEHSENESYHSESCDETDRYCVRSENNSECITEKNSVIKGDYPAKNVLKIKKFSNLKESQRIGSVRQKTGSRESTSVKVPDTATTPKPIYPTALAEYTIKKNQPSWKKGVFKPRTRHIEDLDELKKNLMGENYNSNIRSESENQSNIKDTLADDSTQTKNNFIKQSIPAVYVVKSAVNQHSQGISANLKEKNKNELSPIKESNEIINMQEKDAQKSSDNDKLKEFTEVRLTDLNNQAKNSTEKGEKEYEQKNNLKIVKVGNHASKKESKVIEKQEDGDPGRPAADIESIAAVEQAGRDAIDHGSRREGLKTCEDSVEPLIVVRDKSESMHKRASLKESESRDENVGSQIKEIEGYHIDSIKRDSMDQTGNSKFSALNQERRSLLVDTNRPTHSVKEEDYGELDKNAIIQIEFSVLDEYCLNEMAKFESNLCANSAIDEFLAEMAVADLEDIQTHPRTQAEEITNFKNSTPLFAVRANPEATKEILIDESIDHSQPIAVLKIETSVKDEASIHSSGSRKRKSNKLYDGSLADVDTAKRGKSDLSSSKDSNQCDIDSIQDQGEVAPASVPDMVHNRSITEAIHITINIEQYHYTSTSSTINKPINITNDTITPIVSVDGTNAKHYDTRLVPPIMITRPPEDASKTPDVGLQSYTSTIDNNRRANEFDNMQLSDKMSVIQPQSNPDQRVNANISFGKKGGRNNKGRVPLDPKMIEAMNAGKILDYEKSKDKASAVIEKENYEAAKQIERDYETKDLINEGKQIQRAKIWFYLRHFNIDAKKPTYDQIETAEDFYGMNHPIIVCRSICEKLDKQSKMALKGRSADAVTFIFRDSIWRNVISQSGQEYFVNLFKGFEEKSTNKKLLRKMVMNLRNRASPTLKNGKQFPLSNSKSNLISKADQQTVMTGDLKTGVSRVDWDNLPIFYNIQPLISAKATLAAKLKAQSITQGTLANLNKYKDNHDDEPSITLEQLDKQCRKSLGIALVKINSAILEYYKDELKKETGKDNDIRDDAKRDHCLRMISKIEKRNAGPSRNAPQGIQLGFQDSNTKRDYDKTPDSVIAQRSLERELDNEAKKFDHNKKYLMKDGDRPLYELPVLKEFVIENYAKNIKYADRKKFLVRIRLLPTSPQEFFAIETWTTDDIFIRIKLIASSVFEKDIMSDMTVIEKVNGVISFLVRALVFDCRTSVLGYSNMPDFDIEQGIKRRNDALQNPLICPVF